MKQDSKSVDTGVSLGQALLHLDNGWKLRPEADFRVARTPRQLPGRRDLRERLIGAIVDGDLTVTGNLVAMDRNYDTDENGNLSRRDIERQVLQQAYKPSSEAWWLERTDFYLSALELEEPPDDVPQFDDEGFNDEPWFRVSNLRISRLSFEAFAGGGKKRDNASRGRPPKMDAWREIFADVIEIAIRAGLSEDDREWHRLIEGLRAEYVFAIGDSAIRKTLMDVKAKLKARGVLRSI